MLKKIKKMIWAISPVFLADWYRRHSVKNRKFGFMRECSSWAEARDLTSGYDSTVITQTVIDAALQVKNGSVAYERDGVLSNKINHSWHLLASLLWVASQNDNALNILDFGGAMGTSYFQNRQFLSHLKNLKWNIVEQDAFVEAGKKSFEDAHLKFYRGEELASLLNSQKPDVLICSSSLQYIEKPYEILERLIASSPRFIVIDKTPFIQLDGKDHLMVQKVSKRIYDASYPAWVFDLEGFLSFLKQRGYALVEEINRDQRDWFTVSGKPVDWLGFLFKKQ